MACPTCGHTMASLGGAGGVINYHCPRCGTVVAHYLATPGAESVYVPKLVERCRAFKAETAGRVPSHIVEVWHRLGVCEAINIPANRGCTPAGERP